MYEELIMKELIVKMTKDPDGVRVMTEILNKIESERKSKEV